MSLVTAPRPAAGNGGVIRPQLTSLVDIMTILLVFLLKSFSVEGNLVRPSDDLVLPESKSTERPHAALNIEISQSSINVDGKAVTGTDAVLASDSLMIGPLFDWLSGLSQLTGTQQEDHEVIIQCDRSMDFKAVKKVMFTCAKARYADFSLLVLQKEGP